MKIHTPSPEINKVGNLATVEDIRRRFERLQYVPTLTEAEMSFVLSMRGILGRAVSGDDDAAVAAWKAIEHVGEICPSDEFRHRASAPSMVAR